MSNEITPETLRAWAGEADEGEDVALDGDTLREIAGYIKELEEELEESNATVFELSNWG